MARLLSLWEWMDETGTTQVALSEQTGIEQPLISKYYRRVQRAQVDNALAIERATGGAVPVESWAVDFWKASRRKKVA